MGFNPLVASKPKLEVQCAYKKEWPFFDENIPK
jgi:hypothetical protein